MLEAVRGQIRTRRNSPAIRALASVSTKFLRAWHNEGHYDFNYNGERFALQSFADWTNKREPCIWDVGAHQGEWASEVTALLPTASIHSFELVPAMAEALQGRSLSARHVVHAFGLGRTTQELTVCWNKGHSSTSSIRPRLGSKWFEPTELEEVRAKVIAGDELITSGLAAPDYLKIDVEGAEADVLAGLAKTLSGPHCPDVIQFEYGDTWIPFGHFLMNVHRQLEGAGYRLGRLFPRHVEFSSYDYSAEHFRMGNYIAVKHPDLQKMLMGSSK